MRLTTEKHAMRSILSLVVLLLIAIFAIAAPESHAAVNGSAPLDARGMALIMITIVVVAVRRATAKPIILTYRGSQQPDPAGALAAGIDFIDLEWRDGMQIDLPRERVVLSHHDYDSMPDVETLLVKMRAFGCAHTK